ncbi:hypothetical protein BD324DRAFT_651324 [Kockovaella imperatae]|uniref:SANT domain-containing protein n=1 Tax=Kockovaella imperatae TaxID=4999 RepID=A0A1Y1UFL9_9TREE|nr:hypothetical protein BD324DRAFT_651324 [Kockovaella imperatae]ORX36843.1 hypothetical protein BD324DRAFT_651324 [Kockovaella imperatae]
MPWNGMDYGPSDAPRSLSPTKLSPSRHGTDPPRINFLGRNFARALERDKSAQAQIHSGPVVISRSSAVPRAPRMMRQSSSPSTSTRPRESISSPSSTPHRTVPLPPADDDSDDLEEGELVSPSKALRRPPRRSPTPEITHISSPTTSFLEQLTMTQDELWRRAVVEGVEEPEEPVEEKSVQSDTRDTLDVERPETPSVPPPPLTPGPETERELEEREDVVAELAPGPAPSTGPSPSIKPQSDSIQQPQAPSPAPSPPIEPQNDPIQQPHAPSPAPSPPIEPQGDSIQQPHTPSPAPSPLIEPQGDSIQQPHAPSPAPSPTNALAPRATIAERRSVQLPHAINKPPFSRHDPRVDTHASAESIELDPGPEPQVSEDIRRLKVIAAIRLAQQQQPLPALDIDPVLNANALVAPVANTRVSSHPYAPINPAVSPLVTRQVGREKIHQADKVARLKAEYLRIDKQWKEHCRALDASMELRGPPPADLYATPNALPILTPAAGPAPTTPGDEVFGSRANRRRGAGDSVATEAEFQEILLSLQDTAARDPTYRASKTTAVVPDMILDDEKRLLYDDENDLVTDPVAFYDFNGDAEPEWTAEERATFLRRYLAYPKQFGKIADGLPNKEAAECVHYYYRTKKSVDYKGMLASRRGDKKKRVVPIKKGGKSSALLADMERKKPTVDKTHPGPKSHITPAKSRDLLTARQRVLKETPGGSSSKEGDLVDSSAAPSRAGSEGPSTKSKMRMTVKTATAATTKRPRTSTATETLPTEPATPSDLLPPVKRPGKRRKVDADPNAPDDKPPSRRNATNSYWSVEEKRRFKELYKRHQGDTRAIAAELDGKSERQVSNYYDAHKDQIDGPGETVEEEEVKPPPFTWSGVNPPGPQLGTFPIVAIVPIPRPGGMPLSAMLNNDAAEESSRYGRFDTDNASDATVSERDGENAMTRPSPRSIIPSLATPHAAPPPPSEERRRSSFGAVYERPDHHTTLYSPRPWLPSHRQPIDPAYPAPPPRPSTVAPANPYHASRNSPWHPPSLDRHLEYPRPQHLVDRSPDSPQQWQYGPGSRTLYEDKK